MKNDLVFDATNLILGRLSSVAAKQLLLGKRVTIVNAEKTVISGSRKYILERAKKHLETRTLGAQSKAPKHPRKPELIIRRTVRGMLPFSKPIGKMAFRRLKVYTAVPEDLKGYKIESIPKAKVTKGIKCLVISEVAKNIGWKSAEEN